MKRVVADGQTDGFVVNRKVERREGKKRVYNPSTRLGSPILFGTGVGLTYDNLFGYAAIQSLYYNRVGRAMKRRSLNV
jgi:hypothetical protein